MKQLNVRVSSLSAADSKHAVRQQRKPCHQSSDSFLVRPSHSYSTNAATTVKECQRWASTGWQCNRERARRTSCAPAGTACTVFSLWSATNATPAKQEWRGRQALGPEQYVLLHARFSVEGLICCEFVLLRENRLDSMIYWLTDIRTCRLLKLLLTVSLLDSMKCPLQRNTLLPRA